MAMNPSGIRPIAGHVLVRPEVGETERKLQKMGLVAADQTKERDHHASMTGEVVAICDTVQWGVKPGERVLFGRYAGTMVKGVDDQDYRLVDDRDLKGVFDGE